MPFLIGLAYGPVFRAHATDAARLVLVAAALQLVGAGRVVPRLDRPPESARRIAQALETAVFIPLLLFFASKWGATGAAGAMLVATVVFCAAWSIAAAQGPVGLAPPEVAVW